MNNECTVLQFGRRHPMHEPIQSLMPLAMVAPAPAVLDEGRRVIRLGLLVLALAFGGAGLMLGRVPLASAVVAPGVVKVADNRKSVQHLEGGIVKEIRVRNGDRVAAGQTLIVLEDERASAGLDLLAGQWDTAAARAARLQAERDFRSEPLFPERLHGRAAEPRVAELLRTETALFQTRRAALERQLQSFNEQIVEIEQEQASLQAQLGAEKEAGRLLGEELRAYEAGQQQHVVTRVQVLALKRAQQERLARQAELGGAMARSRLRMEELRARAAALRNQYMQVAADELSTIKAQLADLEEKLRPSRDAVNRQAIVAPLAGQVVDLQVFTVGGVVRPGERVLDIVPDASTLLIEARIGLDDIDNLHLQQAVDIRLTAYPTRSTPLLHGVVRYISADQLSDPRTGAAHYIAQVAVEGSALSSAGAALPLQPGMRAELFIKTGERTVLDYLLEPLTATLRRSLREQ